jgi:hypothetical protein
MLDSNGFSQQTTPIFKRYWTKILPDGSKQSMFGDDGTYNLWKDDIQADKIFFEPITLNDEVRKIKSKGSLAETNKLPRLEFDVKGREVKYHRTQITRVIPHAICTFCGSELNEGVELVCPCCLGRNWFYCDKCDELKDHMKEDDKLGLCPDCVEPRGLMTVKCIMEEYESKISYFHVLEIDGHRHLIFDLVQS